MMFKTRIIEMGVRQIIDVNKPNEPFLIIGKLLLKFDGSNWTFDEVTFKDTYEKKYSNDELDYTNYIDNIEKVVFLSYSDEKCIGQIRLRKNWNKFGFIEDLAVCKRYRRRGIGNALILEAINWAKKKKMAGLMSETQDINLSACRFYLNCGFKIGAVDTMLYANTENANEKAVFFYLKF